MKVTFLGTGTSTGIPFIGCKCAVCLSEDSRDKRLRTSVMVETGGNRFIIDSGPDFRQQILRTGIDDITAIIYTHEHTDHIIGMDDVRPFNFLKKKTISLYATEQVQENIKRIFNYVFAEKKYPGIPQVELNTITDEAFEINGTSILPIKVMHYRLPVLGFRFGNFAYITDANFIDETEKEKLHNCEVLVLNALRKETHLSHFTLEEAVALVEELKPQKAYFTHISHQLGRHAEVESELPPHIRLAHDELVLDITDV